METTLKHFDKKNHEGTIQCNMSWKMFYSNVNQDIILYNILVGIWYDHDFILTASLTIWTKKVNRFKGD